MGPNALEETATMARGRPKRRGARARGNGLKPRGGDALGHGSTLGHG